MKKHYVSLETAKVLKEKGFKESCFGRYTTLPSLYKKGTSNYSLKVDEEAWSFNSHDNTPYVLAAPELYEVQQWLREERKIDVLSVRSFAFNNSYYWEIIPHGKEVIQSESNRNISYEEALEAGIMEALKMI